MKIKKSIIIILASLVLLSSVSAEIALEFPIKGTFYVQSIDQAKNVVHNTPTFRAFVWPIRLQYLFEKIGPWTFGVGGSVVFYPFQVIAASGSATVQLAEFKNGGFLEIANNIDFGLFMYFLGNYNVAGQNQQAGYFSPFFEYALHLNYRNPNINDWYMGLGFDFDLANVNTLILTYSVDFTFGYRFQTKKDRQKRQTSNSAE